MCSSDLDEVVASADFEFFGHDAEAAVGSDEVDGLNASVSFKGEQEVFEK